MSNDKLIEMMQEYADRPLREVVFQTLRKGILRGEFQPGERLMEIHLANRLGVSRTPIREAMRLLEIEGLIVNTPRHGAQVASITEKDLMDVLEVREGLEEMAVQLASERITADELDALYEASRSFEQVVNDTDVTKLAEADEAFHMIIYRATKNERLVKLISNLREQMYRYRVEYLKNEATRGSLVEEHDKLWRCFRDGDTQTASDYMRRHIEGQRENIREKLKRS